MKRLNPVERSRYIDSQYREYLRSTFQFGNSHLQKSFERELEEAELFKGPYVAIDLPFSRGRSIDQMIEDGVMSRHFRDLGDMNLSRPLYKHQEIAIEHICAGKSAVVTTGTGSGKTECFLYPILNEILLDYEKGNRDVGIRAIFLYPMNALVNDQMDRLRKILSDFPEITYGCFTGDTKESVSTMERDKMSEELGVKVPENELISREEIRNKPPHILFTNYSMLEYLMIRPNDYSIFTKERLKNWKFVVLDEAHTYHGSLGIEISMLLRRVTALAEKKPRFILTSATLGEEGKSEGEIVDFARKLTASTFEHGDIIFSKRIPLTAKIEYRVAGEDYHRLKSGDEQDGSFNIVFKKYGIDMSDYKRGLYELLVKDDNVHVIYSMLRENAKTFGTLLNGLPDLQDEDLIVLIDLINTAEKDGIGLFDLKYHSFVRPLSGAFVSLGNNMDISLSKTNHIGDLKAFEVGNCRYCGSPFVFGRMQYDQGDGLFHLYQNDEIDIYENYDKDMNVNIDYFLLQNSVNEDEVDKEILEQYGLCAKCGNIYSVDNLNAKKCNCGDGFKRIVYKVGQTSKKDEELKAYNNIGQCPCCGHKSRNGVVRSMNLGKDEGTALVAQMLFEAIGSEDELAQKKPGKLSLKLKESVQELGSNNRDDSVKQFLEFSDSRQQASFAAVFLDATHVRMLRKRLIWEVIKNNNYMDLTFDEAASFVAEMIKRKNYFLNEMTSTKNAWVTLLVDLLKVDGSYDGEGLGLYYFDLDLSDIMDQLDENDVKEEFGAYGITKSDLATVMQVVFEVFKTSPAIDYVKSTLTPDERRDNLDFRRFDNSIMLKCPKTMSGIRSFLPIKGNGNMVTRYVSKVFGCNEEFAESVLTVLFSQIGVASGLFKKDPAKDVYKIDASKYILKNHMNSKYYQCEKCGRLTPYNVHDLCVQDKCDGRLQLVDPDEVLKDNYYRNQYKNKKLESVVIKEHTAQLDRKKAKQYQVDFKNKKINILSCSTTFEMGIDIGDLDTVFMRNVPPTPANYVQRAGRAGRRKNSFSYILTYCGTGSHDYNYFSAPEKMISGQIRPPYFDVLNKKIITRHLMASSLGYFFRSHPDFFKSIDGIVFHGGADEFCKYVSSHPADLNDYINNRVIPERVYSDYHNFSWFSEMGEDDEKLRSFVETIQKAAKEYDEAKSEALNNDNYREAGYFNDQIKKLHNMRVVDSLSKYCVIPKYGFPVDVVELQVYDKGVLNASYDLSRDLRIAISEYAPDSEVVVDGKKYTSKYISLPKTSHLPKRFFCTCGQCRKVNVFLSSGKSKKCKYCGTEMDNTVTEYYIEPIEGFKTGETKESTHMKPKRTYAGEVTYLGGGDSDNNKLDINSNFQVETSTNDELLVMNRTVFYMCDKCGFSLKNNNWIDTPIVDSFHKNYRLYNCENNQLERLRIGHSFQTDVARISTKLVPIIEERAYSRALSFLYAFLEGVSIALNIERNDIDGIIEPVPDKGTYDILIYDNVPGGAGHVKRLVDKEAIVISLEAALAKVSQGCCDEDTSCYNCLRNYYNQMYHSKLKRRYAKEILETMLNTIDREVLS